MNGYELAIVQEKDIGMISCIHTISFDDAWSGAMIRRILAMPGTFGIVAMQSRQWSMVGFVLGRIAADECEILSIAVAPDHRGAHVGAMLLDGAMHQAAQGVPRNSFSKWRKITTSPARFTIAEALCRWAGAQTIMPGTMAPMLRQ